VEEINVTTAKECAEFAGGGWQSMKTHPRDGSQFSVLYECKAGLLGVVDNLFWGDKLMGRGRMLRGTQNRLSPYLTPLAWRPPS
jgi:hypothetical protein